MEATNFATMLARNREYAKTAAPMPYVSDFPQGFALPRVIIFCCFDFRIDPGKLLQLKPGEAVIVRNVGGSARQNINDIIYTDQSVNFVLDEIVIIHHDDCGTMHLSGAKVKTDLRSRYPDRSEEVDALTLPTHYADDIERSIREDVQYIRGSTLIRPELRRNSKGVLLKLKSNEMQVVEV